MSGLLKLLPAWRQREREHAAELNAFRREIAKREAELVLERRLARSYRKVVAALLRERIDRPH